MNRNVIGKISFATGGVLIAVLAVATIIQKTHGQRFCQEHIYSHPLFYTLWGVLAVSAIIYVFQTKMCKTSAAFLLHISFALILAGALTTGLTARSGTLFLSQDSAPATMFTTADGSLEKMPFGLQLSEFRIEYYPDGRTPRDYTALLRVIMREGGERETPVSMNNIFSYGGCRICLQGYDKSGITLFVNCDTAGTGITYAGYLLLSASIIMLFFDPRSGFRRLATELKLHKRTATTQPFYKVLVAIELAAFLYLSCIGIMRIARTGQFPASNGYEALLLLAWCALLGGLTMRKRIPSMLYCALGVAGLALVAALATTDGQTTMVIPVLRTPLLGVHVATIIAAYTLFGIMAANAAFALIAFSISGNRERMEHRATVGRLLLYPAVALLVTGIFIGAVWANISWGRYWGWDPKEVWALITLFVAATGFHTRSLPFMGKAETFHIFCIVAFAAVLFTYFGVNFFLGGLHSYA